MAEQGNTNGTAGGRGCTSCGANNAADARFCSSCGAGLPPPATAGGASDSVSAMMDSARQHALLGHWEDAALAAEAVLTLQPGLAEGHHIAARARLRQGMARGALTHAEKAVELEPGSSEYQATLAEAMRANSGRPAMNTPAMIASVVALVVFGVIAIFAMSHRGPDPTRLSTDTAPPTSGPSSFAQPSGNTPMPQPEPTPGVDTNRPRIPASTAQPVEPGPAPAGGSAPGPPMPTGGLPAVTGGGGPVAAPLAPAPVQTPALQPFPEPLPTPAPARPAPTRPAPTPTLPYSQPATPPGVTAAPPVQPGGTIFGAAPSAQRPTNVENAPNPFAGNAAPAPAAPAPAPPPASPQQDLLDRNYGGAIHSLEQRIQAGQATGANYQLLGQAYAQVGDKGRAAEAYRNAIAAFRGQVQAGTDAEVARRGLRNAEQQLRILQSR